MNEEPLRKHEENNHRECQKEYTGKSKVFLLEIRVIYRLQSYHQNIFILCTDKRGRYQV